MYTYITFLEANLLYLLYYFQLYDLTVTHIVPAISCIL